MAFGNFLGEQLYSPIDVIPRTDLSGNPLQPGTGSPYGMSFAADSKPPMQPARRPSGFRNVLGQIGDALLIATRRDPIYRPAMQRREAAEALGGYFDNPQAAIQNYLAIDPENGARLLNAHLEHQDRLARAKAGPEPTTFARDLAALGIDLNTPEGQAIGRRLYEARTNQMRLYGSPESGYQPDPNYRPIFGDDGEPIEQGEDDLPLVNTPEEARRLSPGTRFRNPQGEILTVPGGPTPSASGNFP